MFECWPLNSTDDSGWSPDIDSLSSSVLCISTNQQVTPPEGEDWTLGRDLVTKFE